MGIATNIRRPVTAVSFNIIAARAGLAELGDARILLVGMKLAAGTAIVEEPVRVLDTNEAIVLFGLGSDAHNLVDWAYRGIRDYGSQAVSQSQSKLAPEVWVTPVADPAGTAQLQTFTVTAGTADEAGDIVVKIAGRTITASVAFGADQDAAALAIAAAIQEASPDLMLTAAAVTNIVTCTSRHTSVIGNDVVFEVVSFVSGLTTTTIQTVPGVGVYDITAALDASLGKDYDFVATSNHAVADAADFVANFAVAWAPTQKRNRVSIMAENGAIALATTLAAASDSFEHMVYSARNGKNMPGEYAAYQAGFLASESNPSIPQNTLNQPALFLPDEPDVPTAPEIEVLIAAGASPLSINEAQTRVLAVKHITTKVTHNSVAFYKLANITIVKIMIRLGRQLAADLDISFPQARINERTRKAVRSKCIDVLKILEDQPLEMVKNVDDFLGELIVKTDDTNPEQLDITVPADPVFPLNQKDITINLIL